MNLIEVLIQKAELVPLNYYNQRFFSNQTKLKSKLQSNYRKKHNKIIMSHV